MSKIWIGCTAAAATLAALIVDPGQAAQQIAAAEPAAVTAPEVKLAQAPVPQPQAIRQASSAEQPARAVRVVYPSHYSAQR
ncbi:hypothetical protein [Methylobacterium oxalidis]|uniref:hypothetical protein n=1 Tax=Methylobacterium oxalidis TaxID=944322 RepID=UPI003314B881